MSGAWFSAVSLACLGTEKLGGRPEPRPILPIKSLLCFVFHFFCLASWCKCERFKSKDRQCCPKAVLVPPNLLSQLSVGFSSSSCKATRHSESCPAGHRGSQRAWSCGTGVLATSLHVKVNWQGRSSVEGGTRGQRQSPDLPLYPAPEPSFP